MSMQLFLLSRRVRQKEISGSRQNTSSKIFRSMRLFPL